MFHAAWTALKPLLFLATGGYAGVSLLMFLIQSRFVYHPRRELNGTPADIGMPYEEITITSQGNVPLNGWFVTADPARCTVLFCHGNAGNISNRLGIIEILHNLGMNVLMFDYRGYGNSGGAPSEEGTYQDADAAWNYLTDVRGIAPGQIVIWGRSLGGAIAARLASHTSCLGLVLESTFTSLIELGGDLYGWLPVRALLRYGYPTRNHLRRISCPVLVIHSPEDDLVPYRHGKRLYDMAPTPKQFLTISGGHNRGNLDSGAVYPEGIDRFITSCLHTRPETPASA